MTIHIPLLLLSLATTATAHSLALAQDAPPPEMSPQVKRDLVRGVRIMAGSSAAYTKGVGLVGV